MRKQFRQVQQILLAAGLCVAMSACGSSAGAGSSEAETEAVAEETTVQTEPETEPEPAEVKETAHIKFDSIYIDSSYESSESPNIKRVYVFYNVFTNDQNLENFTSNSLTMKINDTNSYEAKNAVGVGRIFKNWYYKGDGIRDIYIGEDVKVMSTFIMPEAELAPGREITFETSKIPDIDEIRISTDEVVTCASPEEIAQAMDPEGLAAEEVAQQQADEETTKKVRDTINGYVLSTSFGSNGNKASVFIAFDAPNTYEVGIGTQPMGSNVTGSGKYTVKNGYVSYYAENTDTTVDIPWIMTDEGKVQLDINAQFHPQLMR